MILPFLLIIKEPDLGSGLVLLPTGLAMIYRGRHAGAVSTRVLGVIGILSIVLVADLVYAPAKYRVRLPSYMSKRLLVYFGRNYARLLVARHHGGGKANIAGSAVQKDSYNVRQSLDRSQDPGGLFGQRLASGPAELARLSPGFRQAQ